MLEPQPAEPRYWKALIFISAFAIPIAWFSSFVFRMPPIAWFIVTPVFIFGASYMLHMRIKDDWRAQDTMDLSRFEARHRLGRNVRIRK